MPYDPYEFASGDIITEARINSLRAFDLTDTNLSASANVSWAKLNKDGSSLADLQNRSASHLSGGTLPDDTFPAILPSVSGINLTNLDGSNIASGTVSEDRLPTISWSKVDKTGSDITDLGGFPSQATHGGKFLSTDGSTLSWQDASSTENIEVLIVAGGGAGGGGHYVNPGIEYIGGGGGGGGVIHTRIVPSVSQSFAVTIGLGGTGVAQANGNNGGNTSFGSLTATGGGGGAYGDNAGASGGSAGGSCGNSGTFPQGTDGQGNNAGRGFSFSVSPWTYKGGGGGGGAGGNGISSYTRGDYGAGGAGYRCDISGSMAAYAGGGSSGFAGGQGSGSTANRGGGGQGSGGVSAAGGNGGSGVVIVRYSGSTKATGGTITSANGYTIHTFTTDGTFTWTG